MRWKKKRSFRIPHKRNMSRGRFRPFFCPVRLVGVLKLTTEHVVDGGGGPPLESSANCEVAAYTRCRRVDSEAAAALGVQADGAESLPWGLGTIFPGVSGADCFGVCCFIWFFGRCGGMLSWAMEKIYLSSRGSVRAGRLVVLQWRWEFAPSGRRVSCIYHSKCLTNHQHRQSNSMTTVRIVSRRLKDLALMATGVEGSG